METSVPTLSFSEVFNFATILNTDKHQNLARREYRDHASGYFDREASIIASWTEYTRDTVNALKTYVESGAINIQNIQAASYCITELYDMSYCFTYENKTYNMSPHLKRVLTSI